MIVLYVVPTYDWPLLFLIECEQVVKVVNDQQLRKMSQSTLQFMPKVWAHSLGTIAYTYVVLGIYSAYIWVFDKILVIRILRNNVGQ